MKPAHAQAKNLRRLQKADFDMNAIYDDGYKIRSMINYIFLCPPLNNILL